MMGFAELPLLVVVGFLVLGPRRMQEVLRQVARVKAKLERSTREITSSLAAEMERESSPRN